MTTSESDITRGPRRRRTPVALAAVAILLLAAGAAGAYGLTAGWFGGLAGRDGSFHGHVGQVGLDAAPGTWPALTRVTADAGGPVPRVTGADGLTGARTLLRLSAAHEPAHPVLVRLPLPAGVAADRSVLAIWPDRGSWSPLLARVSSGTATLVVPHFSDIWLLTFASPALAELAMAARLVATAGTWLQERLGMSTCRVVDLASGSITRFGPDRMAPDQWLADGRLIGSYESRTQELRAGTHVVGTDGSAIEIGTGQRFIGVQQP